MKYLFLIFFITVAVLSAQEIATGSIPISEIGKYETEYDSLRAIELHQKISDYRKLFEQNELQYLRQYYLYNENSKIIKSEIEELMNELNSLKREKAGKENDRPDN